jgi:hypothetical protein
MKGVYILLGVLVLLVLLYVGYVAANKSGMKTKAGIDLPQYVTPAFNAKFKAEYTKAVAALEAEYKTDIATYKAAYKKDVAAYKHAFIYNYLLTASKKFGTHCSNICSPTSTNANPNLNSCTNACLTWFKGNSNITTN